MKHGLEGARRVSLSCPTADASRPHTNQFIAVLGSRLLVVRQGVGGLCPCPLFPSRHPATGSLTLRPPASSSTTTLRRMASTANMFLAAPPNKTKLGFVEVGKACPPLVFSFVLARVMPQPPPFATRPREPRPALFFFHHPPLFPLCKSVPAPPSRSDVPA